MMKVNELFTPNPILIDPTTTVAALNPKTFSNGYFWRRKLIRPNDSTIYVHVDGESWNPFPRGWGRWFGQYSPERIDDARRAYNLPVTNAASHAHLFKFEVSGSDRRFCYFESRENHTGIWQAVFPGAMIDSIFMLDIVRLRGS